MDTIAGDTLRQAALYVDECRWHADIHTVTITLNGQHGGADVLIQGFATDSTDEYERTFDIAR